MIEPGSDHTDRYTADSSFRFFSRPANSAGQASDRHKADLRSDPRIEGPPPHLALTAGQGRSPFVRRLREPSAHRTSQRTNSRSSAGRPSINDTMSVAGSRERPSPPATNVSGPTPDSVASSNAAVAEREPVGCSGCRPENNRSYAPCYMLPCSPPCGLGCVPVPPLAETNRDS